MASIFALPLPPREQPTSGTYIKRVQKRKKKRKRREEQDEDTVLEDTKDTQTPEYSAVITPEERSQRRVAGQSFDQDPPQFPFPHSIERSHTGAGPSQQTSSKGSPYGPGETRRQPRGPTLHLQHLGAMTAILHRSLMAKDFNRAGRALSLLLRDSFGGHDIDIRSEGRWGIGAEVLLRGGTRNEQKAPVHITGSISQPSDREAAAKDHTRLPSLTLVDFENAKLYYEGLITQHPFQKLAATAVNALHFYVALFGLWIFVVREESMASDAEEEEEHEQGTGSHASGSSGLHSGKHRELELAQEIATRMDEVMSMFPYSDDGELIRLRVMVALWLADLIDYCTEPGLDDSAMEPEFAMTDSNAAGGQEDGGRMFGRGHASRMDSTQCRATARELRDKLRRQRSPPLE